MHPISTSVAARRMAGAVALLFLALLLVTTAFGQEQAGDYLSEPSRAEKAIERMVEEIGRTPKVSRITIEPERITILVQGEKRPYDVDEWSVTRLRKWFLDYEVVSGPEPSQTDTIVKNAEGGFFDLEEIAFDKVPEVIAAAVERAALEDPAQVQSLTIDRHVSILPEPAYGDVRWTIPVASGRESATVYADAGGAITRADLSQTNRARRLDLIAQDDWPMAQAEADLLAVIGPGEVVYEVRVYNTYIFVVAEHPTDPKQTRDYSWDLSGVKRGLMDSPNLASIGGLRMLPFSLTDLDLERLPQIKAAAREALGMPGERITFIEAEKSAEGAGEPVPLWEVEITDKKGEEGVATISSSGEVMAAVLPPSRRPVEPWLAPATILKTLARMEREFGANARFDEILIDDSKASVLIEDPRAPGTMASFIVDPEKITRFGTPMPWEAKPNPARLFSFADMKPLTAERLSEFSSRTVERMKLDGAQVYRYTISKGVMTASPRGMLTVEVRAGTDQGWVGGWVVFETDGTEIDVMTP